MYECLESTREMYECMESKKKFMNVWKVQGNVWMFGEYKETYECLEMNVQGNERLRV